jgi:HAE1 family hydrophobic/amphiphilic exporter-1/multidrug efflux pump
MTPIEAAIKGSNEIFCSNFYFYHWLVFLPVIFLEGFVGRLFREFGVVIGAAVLISAFVSNIDTNAKCLFNERRRTKKSNFII